MVAANTPVWSKFGEVWTYDRPDNGWFLRVMAVYCSEDQWLTHGIVLESRVAGHSNGEDIAVYLNPDWRREK